MAFDQTTRNRLQRFVSDAKTLLIQEFTRQLQNEYGLNPETGEVSALSKLVFLDDARRETAGILRETMAHYGSTTPGANSKEVLSRIVREQAFTILNRMAALRMAEARGILMESIGKGYQSKGFQLYSYMTGSALGESGDAYQHYIFSIFDEFSLDLKVLFDRFSSQGRLFPKPSTLLELLDLINHPDIEALWVEDETIGWIYQYFNSKEERKKMRDASQAPRNSRELAVRNQFFTPRYVVEFLTDNTLGRIWYEMTQGKTALVESCSYLVHRPNEIFLKKGANPPETEEKKEDLSQEDLLKQTVYVPFRQLKDPRELKMLDPACGSMHFGLYAFDLFEKIYDEAWELEATLAPENFERSKTFRPLHESYEDKSHFLQEVPRLIIENNIHGVDIDPRAVQIAGLSLWLRAQKAWHEMGATAAHRPQIQKSNIVCAEPMPGEENLLKEFTANIHPRVIGQLVEIIFEKMKLAGEAGSLLNIEEEIQDAIKEAREEYNQEVLQKKGEKGFLPGMAPIRQPTLFDFIDLPDDEDFWDQAEHKILDGLRDYAEHAEGEDSSQKRLFAQDAAKGFAFIDLCRKRFDVVLMNPPFGEFSKQWKTKVKAAYPNSYNDILGAFVERSLYQLHPGGRLAAITSRTCFFLTSFKDWRRKVVLKKSALHLIADLGQGVMDDAMVEAAAYVLERSAPTSKTAVFRSIAEDDRQKVIECCIDAYKNGTPDPRLFIVDQASFNLLPNAPFVYWIDGDIIKHFLSTQKFEPYVGNARQGLATGDDLRFVRTVWEVLPEDTQFCYYPTNGDNFCHFDDPIVQAYFRRRDVGKPQWAFHVKAGASQPWYSPITLKVNWSEEGKELRNFTDNKGKLRSRPQNMQFYYMPGFSWTRRAVRLYPYVIPGSCIPSVSRYMAFPKHGKQIEALGVCASRIASAFLRFFGEKFEWPNFLVETLKELPWPEVPEETLKYFESVITAEVKNRRIAYQNHEPFNEFLVPVKIKDFSDKGKSLTFEPESLLGEKGEKLVGNAYGLTSSQMAIVEKDLLEAISMQKGNKKDDLEKDSEEGKEFFIDMSPKAIEETSLSYLVGCVFGRWDINYAIGKKEAPGLTDPFAPLPVCPPGMLQNDKGLPAEPDDIPVEYPLRIIWNGILVIDKGHPDDIITSVLETMKVVWNGKHEEIEQTTCKELRVKKLRDYFTNPGKFFADHLRRYSKSRRQAPIYWPLSTPSNSYTLWLYYHRLSDQILYTCINDFVEPKLKQVTDDVGERQKNTTRSTQEEKDLEKLINLELELTDFRDELLRIAKFWKPNLNDGVQITAAPLWKLFQHKPWQNKLKETWEKLEKGDYDWAHLAYSIWPERVKEKCKTDKSLAIAHDLEDLYEEPPEKPKKKRRKKAK